MTTLDLEAEYNNRRRVPECVDIMARWTQAAIAARTGLSADLDIAYGPRERHRYDLFAAAGGVNDAPVVVYIHGGYWQRGDRRDYSFVARDLVAKGLQVAIPSYSLCPAVSVADIVEEMRLFLSVLWQRTQRRSVVVGHSAGGHLAAAMLATDWSQVRGVPADLVRSAVPISGVFELWPLVPTSINEACGLTESTARAASLMLWTPPPQGTTCIATVGGAESGEFLRQSRDLATAWSAAGVQAELLVVPNANHFTVVDEITRPGSVLLTRIVEMATV